MEVCSVNKRNNNINFNLRCSRYQSKSKENGARCPTSLTNSIQEIFSHSGLDRVVNRLNDFKYIRKAEQMSSEQRKNIINLMFKKIPDVKKGEINDQIYRIMGLKPRLENNIQLNENKEIRTLLEQLKPAEEIKLMEIIFRNLSEDTREEILLLLI